jgi:outer membrane protein OmpA-like peptidoglycan-associated protein
MAAAGERRGAAVTAITAAGNGLKITTNAPVESFGYFTMKEPARLVIDLPGLADESGEKTIPLGAMGIAGVRVDTAQGKVRVVLDADRESFPRFRVEASDSGLMVSLVEDGEQSGAPAPGGEAPVPAAAPAGKTMPPHTAKGNKEFFRFTVEFDTAKATIGPAYYGVLRKAASLLKANPGTIAEISGHTDNVGTARYNMRLSHKRAGAVRSYLVTNSGIDASRIIVRGYGFYFPVADNGTAAGRRKNRRTEMTIVIRQKGASPAPAAGTAR